ncbi:hypothetical protein AGR5A_Lc110109 [Agrobacterium genomosp. 5 str. CFBP 6626]|nr:hypothetical protein AGR5A_Lc110109 [Agrobacterium genomosp. 5 str. CFBP 6626]
MHGICYVLGDLLDVPLIPRLFCFLLDHRFTSHTILPSKSLLGIDDIIHITNTSLSLHRREVRGSGTVLVRFGPSSD